MRFGFSAVSATIDNDWSIFSRTVPNRARPANSKRPSRRFYHTSAPPNRGGPQSTPPAGISAPKVPPIWVAPVPVEKRTRKLANCRIERVVIANGGKDMRAFGPLAEERHQTIAKTRPLEIAVR